MSSRWISYRSPAGTYPNPGMRFPGLYLCIQLDLLNCLLSSIVNIIQGQYCLFFSCFFSVSCFLYRSAADASPRILKMNPFASVESVNCCVATGLLTFVPKIISFCTYTQPVALLLLCLTWGVVVVGRRVPAYCTCSDPVTRSFFLVGFTPRDSPLFGLLFCELICTSSFINWIIFRPLVSTHKEKQELYNTSIRIILGFLPTM